MPTAALHNLGCKVNSYETDVMQQMLEEAGYEIKEFNDTADVYIINTCTVTNMADRKSRQMLHKAKSRNENAIVVAVGCYAQAAGEKLLEDSSVDIVIGNNRKKDLIRILEEYRKEHRAEDTLIDINHTTEYETLMLGQTSGHTRAYIKIQDGCNQFCSYCIIPYARGRVRSREEADIEAEVTSLAAKGYKEIVITGIHISSYGVDKKDTNLLKLLQRIHKIEGLERIRLGSLEPRIITEEFAREIAALPKICPHFHLSMQSGCNETLRRMNRHYTSEEYYEKCEILRKHYEKPAITTDVIVGFPQESVEEFEATEKFVEKVNFFETHIFKYSKRQGTNAAKMEGQIPEEEKTRRSSILLDMNKRHRQAYLESFLGKTIEILVEEDMKADGQEYQTGHTKEYMRAIVKSDKSLENQIVKAVVKEVHQGEMLKCEIID
ncbi:MAG: tRNA (N(6)-L-threonylcarbamoyladenosine(37)-C(2))-methylthiotransferase MtaB [Lachnospiraceae bacterium]|nr:tRNA (N(6)-L-threonylcarbamoyladenosine(37)-C(2))-methylthiotransferase MtaB [Lachnospiraceae bacterium]